MYSASSGCMPTRRAYSTASSMIAAFVSGGGAPNGFRLLYTERTQDELQLDVTGCAWPPVFEREVVGGVPTIKRSAADVERLARAPFDSNR